MYKCKQNLSLPVFCNIFTHKTKTKCSLRNENPVQEPLCRTNFSQYSISYREPNLWKKIVILTISISTLSDSHSLQAFQRELKSFCLSVELNI